MSDSALKAISSLCIIYELKDYVSDVNSMKVKSVFSTFYEILEFYEIYDLSSENVSPKYKYFFPSRFSTICLYLQSKIKICRHDLRLLKSI